MAERLSDFHQVTYSPWRRLSLHEVRNGDWYYRSGYWRGSEGIATVSVTGGKNSCTIIDVIHAGKIVTRSWSRVLGDKTISRVAREMLVALADG